MSSDTLAPYESFTTSDITKGVKLRMTDTDAKLFPPITIYSMFRKTVDERPNHPALGFKTLSDTNGTFTIMTFSEYFKMCHRVAKSFIKLGLNVNECVAIIGFNAPQWFFSILGAIFAGGIGCGIYTTNSAEACEYVLTDSKSRIVVVENKIQLDKILKSKDRTNLIKIIQYTGTVENNHDGLVIDWNSFLEIGNNVNDSELQARINTLAPNKCASLIYTSGTTGNPKAAMISHDCIAYTSRYLPAEVPSLKRFNERLVSFLPLSHIAAQQVDMFMTIAIGGTVYFAQPDALKGTLSTTLKEVRPTFFFAVPRVWEKMQEGVEKVVRSLQGIKSDVFKWSRKLSAAYVKSNFENQACKLDIPFCLTKNLILKKVHKELGLDQCKFFFSGAAPITKETLEFFFSIGIPLCEVYGMSETTGPHSNGLSIKNRIGSIGPLQKFNQSKIVKTENDVDSVSGELCIYGRHVFMGYLNDDKKTKDTFDENGWLHTGDMAKIDDGFLYITGRIKELIITAGGENIPPVPIEDNLKAELPRLISNSMVIGDKRKYLTILVTLKTIINLDTLTPTDDLMPECIEYLKPLGSKSTKLSEVLANRDEVVYKAIEQGIKRINEKSTSNASKVQKFTILPRDFSLITGELGPTLKLRRQIVNQMYANEINQMYQQNEE
jgi:long-chain-fatty-acid--CoA ligase ACSBG